MNCDEYRAAFLAGTTEPRHRAHFAHCSECQADEPRLEELRGALADTALWEEPPVDLGDRVVSALQAAVTPRRRHRSWLAWGAAAVAALAVAIGVSLAVADGADWDAPVTGQGSAAGASGSVLGWSTAGGSRLELHIEGLAPAPDGHYYEFWMSSDQRIVSAGTFREADGVVLWAAASRSELPRLWVTLEPADGNPLPSGETVLDSRS